LSRKGEDMAENNHYYVNDNPQANSGDHEVHKDGCAWLVLAVRKTYLGYFTNCKEAIAKAKTVYAQVDGCAYCCKECHKS